MNFVIFSGGDVQKGKFVAEAIKSANITIAADAGADSALSFGIAPSVVVGDFDSIKNETKKFLEEKKSIFIPYNKEKNETDTEIAVVYAINRCAENITILGGVLGNRLDHVFGNMLLSFYSSDGGQNPKHRIFFVNGNQKMWGVHGPAVEDIKGRKGDLLSIIPVGKNASGFVTSGLKYPLHNETLLFGKTRGISNVFTRTTAQVTFKDGITIFVQTAG